MLKSQFQKATPITPAFPNWEKSFVSGPQSTLYAVEHRLATDPTELITHVKFKSSAEGPPGHIHGGASAGLIDEVMGILVWNQHYPCVTQSLSLKYLKPIPINVDAYLVTVISGVSDKTIEVKSTIFNDEKYTYVQGTGIFHRLTAEQLQKFLKKNSTHSPS
jgi:acyl-coenzyme A thioesterase PaaI-like protein